MDIVALLLLYCKLKLYLIISNHKRHRERKKDEEENRSKRRNDWANNMNISIFSCCCSLDIAGSGWLVNDINSRVNITILGSSFDRYKSTPAHCWCCFSVANSRKANLIKHFIHLSCVHYNLLTVRLFVSFFFFVLLYFLNDHRVLMRRASVCVCCVSRCKLNLYLCNSHRLY